jgi:F0F1-type ATP synthase membrane subunit b/b'
MNLHLLAQASQIAGAAIFLIAMVLIWNRFIAPGVKSYQESKNAELAEAEARRVRIRADVAAARAEVERADADARTIRDRIEMATAHERAKTLAEAQAEADRLIRNAAGELERARLAARDRLRIEFIEKALAKARADAPARVSGELDWALTKSTVDSLPQSFTTLDKPRVSS